MQEKKSAKKRQIKGIFPHLQPEEFSLVSQTFGEVLKENLRVHSSGNMARSLMPAANMSKRKEQITALFRAVTH